MIYYQGFLSNLIARGCAKRSRPRAEIDDKMGLPISCSRTLVSVQKLVLNLNARIQSNHQKFSSSGF